MAFHYAKQRSIPAGWQVPARKNDTSKQDLNKVASQTATASGLYLMTKQYRVVQGVTSGCAPHTKNSH
jgi:hypothetical protein